MQHVKDEGTYTCGVTLFPEGHHLQHTVVVREAVKCSSLVEVSHYSSPRVSFETCCIHCGSCNDLEEVSYGQANLQSMQKCWKEFNYSVVLTTLQPKDPNSKPKPEYISTVNSEYIIIFLELWFILFSEL